MHYDPHIQTLIAEAASQPQHDRRAKARTFRSIRRQLDHLLMLQSLGHPTPEGLADRLGDQLVALSRTEPFLSLAEVQ